MKEIGKVLKTEGNFSIVEVGGKYCETCSLKGFCLLSAQRERKIKAKNLVNAKEGDIVIVNVPSKKYLSVTFVIYVLPIIFMLIGAYVGIKLGTILGIKDPDLSPIIFGFSFLFLSFILVRSLSNIINFRPEIEKVIEEYKS